jgi:hypothetical protein
MQGFSFQGLILGLQKTGVTAGTYKSVTVDVYGRVTTGTSPTTLSGFGITDAQGLDATLTALAAYNTNGILTQTAADTFVGRTLTGTANQVIISNGSGVSGNPTFSTPQDIGTSSTPTFGGITINGGQTFNGAQIVKRTVVNDTDYTALVTDYLIAFTNLTDERTITLPSAATAGAGKIFMIVFESGVGDVALNSVVTNGWTSLNTPGESMMVYSNGSSWIELNRNGQEISIFNNSSITIDSLTIDSDITWTGTGVLNNLSGISLNPGSAAARTIGWLSRSTSTGNDLIVEANDAVSGGTNTAGGSLTLQTGKSTGSGKAQIKILGTTNNAASTSDNSLVNRLIINGQVALSSGSAVTLLTIPLATLQMAGGILIYSIDCTDGTDMICDSGSVYFAATNKGGVYSTNSSILGTDATVKSDITDTITNSFSFTTGSNQVLFKLTSTITGQTPTTFRITYQLISGAYQSITAP